jgi:hypothetical protein
VGVLPFADSAARATAIPTPTDGQFTYLQDTNSTEFYNGSAFQALAGGKILQVVRATDTTNRSTTSTSYVDVTGMSVTITPQKSTSALLLIGSCRVRSERASGAGTNTELQITDASNNAISGAQATNVEASGGGWTSAFISANQILIAYDTPGTTSAVTYKIRFLAGGAGQTANVLNASSTGQLYAIEVSA